MLLVQLAVYVVYVVDAESSSNSSKHDLGLSFHTNDAPEVSWDPVLGGSIDDPVSWDEVFRDPEASLAQDPALEGPGKSLKYHCCCHPICFSVPKQRGKAIT